MKKILFIVIVLISLIMINNLVHSIYNIWQKEDFITQAQKELEFQEQENQRLKTALSYSQTQEFIEKEARDKLLMVKKDEQRILIPKGSEKSAQKTKESLPNWRQWWNLFF
jgi:cell division protein FtsB